MFEDDEIMKEVRKAKAKVAQEIGGKGFENYVAYFQKKYPELEKLGAKIVSSPEQIHGKQKTKQRK
jgi:uncharacterized protein YukE